MSDGFRVSVVIPLYNAEKYVERAIRSALDQKEVQEVVVIDDGYPDEAQNIAKRLAEFEDRVKVFCHKNNENLGAGPTRNLGIESATCEYVAFLDADDYYLPDRFKRTQVALEESNASAVYEPVGTEFSNPEAIENFAQLKNISSEEAAGFISFPTKAVTGKDVFNGMLSSIIGSVHTNGITIRKSLFKEAGMFRSDLALHQDTELWLRIAYYGHFVPGEKEQPVAVRVIHEENRISKRSIRSNYLLRKVLYDQWYKASGLTVAARDEVLKRYVQAFAANLLNSNSLLTKVLWRMIYFWRRKLRI